MNLIRFSTLAFMGKIRYRKLTKQERRIAIYYGKNKLTQTEIANMLFISNNTVKNTIMRIFRKLKVHGKDDLTIALYWINDKYPIDLGKLVGR